MPECRAWSSWRENQISDILTFLLLLAGFFEVSKPALMKLHFDNGAKATPLYLVYI